MRTIHAKVGQYIYLSDKKSHHDDYTILLLAVSEKNNTVELGLFDYRHHLEADMVTRTIGFGKRENIFKKTATINALKAEFHGVNFAIEASGFYFIENDFIRSRLPKPKAQGEA